MTALSAIVLALATIAAGGGLLIDDLYRDNPFVRAAWHGADLVTLLVTVPILAAAMAMAARGSMAGRLLWLGMLACLAYGYAYYLFGAAFNAFFLIYVALFAGSGWALAMGLASLDMSRITSGRALRARRLWVAGYMVFVAAGLTTVYVAQSIAFVRTGDVPAIVAITGHPTNLVFALDLSLVAPPLLVGAFWLRQDRAWGYALAVIVNAKGAVYTLSLAVSSVLAVRAGFEDAANELPLWTVLAAGHAAAAIVTVRSLRDDIGAQRAATNGNRPEALVS
jgi:hypothetical protein